ncbi:MAG: PIN domain-containing protein [Actinomycetota bacterium]
MIRALLDTNVLVYLHDGSDRRRRERAEAMLAAAGRSGAAALPVQVLTEFAAVAMRKLDPPMAPEELRLQIRALAASFPVLTITPAVLDEALRGCAVHRLPFFDAQIWAVARLHQIPAIISQDVHAEADGVRWIDPFTDPRPADELLG